MFADVAMKHATVFVAGRRGRPGVAPMWQRLGAGVGVRRGISPRQPADGPGYSPQLHYHLPAAYARMARGVDSYLVAAVDLISSRRRPSAPETVVAAIVARWPALIGRTRVGPIELAVK